MLVLVTVGAVGHATTHQDAKDEPMASELSVVGGGAEVVVGGAVCVGVGVVLIVLC